MSIPNASGEDWKLLASFFPTRWKELGQEAGALKGLRQDKSEESYMRTLLLHLRCGFSMREAVVRARQAGLAELSDVALAQAAAQEQGMALSALLRTACGARNYSRSCRFTLSAFDRCNDG